VGPGMGSSSVTYHGHVPSPAAVTSGLQAQLPGGTDALVASGRDFACSCWLVWSVRGVSLCRAVLCGVLPLW
jgi:hypothetical protein